jgi:hypothetical protein
VFIDNPMFLQKVFFFSCIASLLFLQKVFFVFMYCISTFNIIVFLFVILQVWGMTGGKIYDSIANTDNPETQLCFRLLCMVRNSVSEN